MFSSFKFAAASLFAATLATVSASPIVEQRAPTCKPNFEGNRQTIYHTSPLYRTVNEWTADPAYGGPVTLVSRPAPPALQTGEFLVPITGTPSGTYQFRMVADTNRQYALTVDSNGNVGFDHAGPGAPDPSQSFEIDCETCPVPGSGQTTGLRAQDCVIKHGPSNKCLSGSQAGQQITLAPCNGSSDQKYIFQSGN